MAPLADMARRHTKVNHAHRIGSAITPSISSSTTAPLITNSGGTCSNNVAQRDIMVVVVTRASQLPIVLTSLETKSVAVGVYDGDTCMYEYHVSQRIALHVSIS